MTSGKTARQLVLFASALVLLTACSGEGAAAVEAAASLEPNASEGRWVRPRPVEDVALHQAPARLVASPASEVWLSPPAAGRVTSVDVAPGDVVAAGQITATVVSPDLAEAAGLLLAATTREEAWVERLAQLDALKTSGLARQSELAEARIRLAEARAEREATRAHLRAAGLDEGSARSLVDTGGRLRLRAPVAGVVTEVRARQGQLLQAGDAAVVVQGEGEVRVEARLPAGLAPDEGLLLELEDGRRLRLTLLAADPRLDESDGSRRAWLTPQLGDGELPPSAGARGVVKILPGPGAPAWVLPAEALLVTERGAAAQVRRGAELVEVPLEVVGRRGPHVVVRGGLLATDDVKSAPDLLSPADPGGTHD